MQKIRLKKLSGISIKWRLLLICIILVTAPTITMGLLSYHIFKVETYKAIKEKLSTIANDWKTTTEVYVEEMERILRREDALVRQRLVFTAQSVKKMLEENYLEHKSNPPKSVMEINYESISKIKIGRSGFVFVLDENGKYLVSHNRQKDGQSLWDLQDAQGKFIIQDLIKRAKELKDDETLEFRYLSIDDEPNKPRMKLVVVSYFQPMGMIIGANNYYTDFKSYELENTLKNELRQKISKQKIGENGYIWVLNSNGNYVVSKNKLRDGENIWLEKDRNGEFIIQDIIHKSKTLIPGQNYIRDYEWKDLNEKSPSKKLVATSYSHDWDWIIGASAYEVDFLKGLRIIGLLIFLVCLVFIVFGAIISYHFASSISRPLHQLTILSTKAAAGELNVEVGDIVNARAEVGNLARSFNTMIINLRNKIREIEVTNIAIIKTNKEIELAKEELEKKNFKLTHEMIVRKQITEEFKHSEKRYHSLFSDSLIALWELDISKVKSYLDNLQASGISDLETYLKENLKEVRTLVAKVVVLDVNKATLNLYKIPSKNSLSSGLNSFFSEETYSTFIYVLLAVAKGSQQFETEITFLTTEGEKVNVVLACSVVSGSEKTYSKIVASVIDITARKIAEVTIKEKERFLNDVFTGIQDGISILDKDLKIVRVNRAMEIWYAHAMPLIGKKCYETYHGRSTVCENCPSILAMQTKEAKNEIIQKVDPGGKPCGWLDLYSFPLIEHQTGNITGVIEYIRDITMRKYAEDSLKNAYQKLKDTQNELIQAEKLAALGRFSSGIAHEVKNPLGIILGGAEYLQNSLKDSKDETLKSIVDIIKASTLRADNIIRGLLKFGKPAELKKEKIKPVELIDESLKLLKYRLPLNNITIDHQIPADDFYINVDKNQLQQVLFNLFVNSSDAMPQGGKLNIKSYKSIDPDFLIEEESCIIEITDTGEGISEENLEKLFEPFFTTKRDSKGTGLGLYLCKTIINNHGGEISIVSRPETTGTTVRIFLPLLKE